MTINIDNISEWVVDTNNFRGWAYAFLIDGVCPFTGKTSADWMAEGYSVVSDEGLSSLCAAFEKGISGEWTEVPEEQYNYALDVLPPAKWYDGGFYVPECVVGPLYNYYQQRGEKYYTSLQSIATPRGKILESLEAFLRENSG